MRFAIFALLVGCVVDPLGKGEGDPDVPDVEERNAESLTGSIEVGAELRTTANLNLRSAPSKSSSVVAILPRGVIVKAVDAAPNGVFYRVSYAGKSGWASGAYLERAVTKTVWRPTPGTSWQWQLREPIDTSFNVAMYDVDLFDTPESTIAALHAKGSHVVCYFSAGSYENWRADAASFPAAVLGKGLDGWPGERWLDVRAGSVRAIMKARLDLAVKKSCDAVEPDNVDGYANANGLGLTAADQLAFNRFLAAEAHARALSIGLKNDLAQVSALVDDFDWALNEQCFQYDECATLTPFIARKKAVFQVEYGASPSSVCARSRALGFDTLIKKLELDAWQISCRP